MRSSGAISSLTDFDRQAALVVQQMSVFRRRFIGGRTLFMVGRRVLLAFDVFYGCRSSEVV